MTPDQITGSIREFGLAVALLMVVLSATAIGLRWAAVNIVQPFVERHFAFLDDLTVRLQSQTDAMGHISNTLTHVERRLVALEHHADDMRTRYGPNEHTKEKTS